MIKQVIFDLDGTLVDSLSTYIRVGNEIAKKNGYAPLREEQVKELLKLPMKERIGKLGVPLFKLPKLAIELLGSFSKYVGELKPFDGIQEVLERLYNDGYRLGIISSNSVKNIEAFLKENGLSNMFDQVESSKKLFGKHVTIEKMISKLKIEKEEAIYVGDEQRDIEACKKAGIKVISVLWGFDSLELLEKIEPDFIVSRPHEIVDIIQSIR